MTKVSWMRSIAAVIVGYLLAVLANSAWVIYWYVNRDPTMPAALEGATVEMTPQLVAMTLAMFVVSGFLAGFVLGKVAGSTAAVASLAGGGLLAAVGFINLLMGMSFEPTWHVLAAIFVQAPAVVAGARFLGSNPD